MWRDSNAIAHADSLTEDQMRLMCACSAEIG
jgi:hypothetical protein